MKSGDGSGAASHQDQCGFDHFFVFSLVAIVLWYRLRQRADVSAY
jgi:hypothetical protein